MKKAFVLLVKYIPVIQMAGMLVNNTLYKFDMLPRIGYLLDFKLGIIPPGHKEVGFKELSWSEKDFDEATLNKVRKYRSKKGL